ncbi:initiation-specific alpha-1,6-mannosyltransferase [Coccidioides immitis RMSCC 3703]|uniref:Initiation-specific alpha-1,6-mannosyltransferase n=1 Tax=Coccidioides immitis RMSCC 3703 TaxID=454286 RepID=A0A0J8TMH7_COCIT|nr:initiation-specific alpha-1,6-mannosyltransferase [Coccidioides immitis RMSCC 3703]
MISFRRCLIIAATFLAFITTIGLIIGIEADPDRKDWQTWYSRRIQFCQWTIQSKPGHPILRDVVANITEEALRMKSEGKLKKNKMDKTIVEFTGPAVWTDSIFRYFNNPNYFDMGRRDGNSTSEIGYKHFTGMVAQKAVGDVVVLPITSFSPGVRQMGAEEPEHRMAFVKHNFQAPTALGHRPKFPPTPKLSKTGLFPLLLNWWQKSLFCDLFNNPSIQDSGQTSKIASPSHGGPTRYPWRGSDRDTPFTLSRIQISHDDDSRKPPPGAHILEVLLTSCLDPSIHLQTFAFAASVFSISSASPSSSTLQCFIKSLRISFIRGLSFLHFLYAWCNGKKNKECREIQPF